MFLPASSERCSPVVCAQQRAWVLHVVRQVHVFGFNVDTPSSVPYHYHDKVVGVTSAHSFNYQVWAHGAHGGFGNISSAHSTSRLAARNSEVRRPAIAKHTCT